MCHYLRYQMFLLYINESSKAFWLLEKESILMTNASAQLLPPHPPEKLLVFSATDQNQRISTV